MGKLARELGVLAVERIKTLGFHAVGGVRGLGVMVSPTGIRSWVLRIAINGKRRHIGLGPLREVTLAQARDKAKVYKEQARRGVDPIAERRAARMAAPVVVYTFDQCAESYIEAHRHGWKNAKHAAQWEATLATYASPAFGAIPVGQVERSHVLEMLRPIWTTKTETASRLRARVEAVLSYAMQAGYRPEAPNPARWKGGLDALLAPPGRVAKTKHFAAAPWREMPALWKSLQMQEGEGARALRFLVLTAARSGEVRGAKWAEVADGIWIIPAARTKTGKELRVPLSRAALDQLGSAGKPDALIFPGLRGPLSDMSLTAVLRRMKVDATVHGFRSTFRDWAAEATTAQNHIVEMALGHAIGSAVEAAYRRGDLFDKRAALMAQWGGYCTGTGMTIARLVPQPPAPPEMPVARGQ